MKKSVIIVAMIVIGSILTVTHATVGPVADFNWTPTNPSTSNTITFSDQSTNQSQIIERVWYFGDGNGSIVKNPTHRYAHAGIYTVKLVVIWHIGSDDIVDSVNHTVTVSNQPPVANAGPDRVSKSKTVAFNGSGSYDPDGTISIYKWTFGDETVGNGVTVQHTYASDGTYNVILNVTDDQGSFDTDTAQIKVDTAAPITTAHLNGTLGANGWYVTNVTINLTVNETVSGLNITLYRIDGGNWTEFEEPFVIEDEGQHLLEYYSDDNAGNVETTHNITIKIDLHNPTVQLTSPIEERLYIFGRNIFPTLRKTIIIGKITLTATATDTVAVASVSFYLDDELLETLTNAPYELRLGQKLGNKNISVSAMDSAGRTATDYVNVFIISLFKPREGTDETTPTEPL